jgi:hypothetical protein
MAKIAELYCRGVRQQSKFYFSHWLPNATIELGTVGTLIDGCYFDPKTTLADLGFDFDPANPAHIVDDDSPTPLKLTSGRSAELSTKLAGELNPELPNVPQASAGIAISFSSEGAFVIEAPETFEPRIRNVVALERWIMDEWRARRWQRDWAVIVSLVIAPSASIIVSESNAAKLELAVKADGTVGSVRLGDGSVEFQSVRQSGTIADMSNARRVTPLFKLVGLRRKGVFGGVESGTLRAILPDAPGADTDDVVVTVLGGDDLS